MFFVVALTPEPGVHQQLVPQADEIEAAKWMPLSEFAAIPFTNPRPLLKKIVQLCVAYAKGEYAGLTGKKLVSSQATATDSKKSAVVREDLLLFGDTLVEDDEEAWIGMK
jgi:hypothetical protein